MRRILMAATAIATIGLAGTASADSTASSASGAAAQGTGISATHIENVGSPTYNTDTPDELTTVPSVDGPSLGVGTNPCLQVSSGSLNVLGFGGGLGSTYTDRGCEIRNLAALIHNMGFKRTALILLANSDADVLEAFDLAGEEIPADVRDVLFASPATPPAPADQPRSVSMSERVEQYASRRTVSDSPDVREPELVRGAPFWCPDEFDVGLAPSDKRECFGA